MGLNLCERMGLGAFCSLYPRQCLKIRHLNPGKSESMIRIFISMKKHEARVRDFPSPRTLSSSGPQCPPPSDRRVQAAALSPGPSYLVSGPPLPALSGPRSPGPYPLSPQCFFLTWDADPLWHPCLRTHCLPDLDSLVPTQKVIPLPRTRWTGRFTQVHEGRPQCFSAESACQSGGHGCNPWSRKLPHASGRLRPFTTTTELML